MTTRRVHNLATLMESSEVVLESEDVHLAALVTGEAYVIAWPDEESRTAGSLLQRFPQRASVLRGRPAAQETLCLLSGG